MKTRTQEPIREMTKIKLITFDLDDTFWDIRDTIINAEMNSRKWSEDKIGEKIEWGTFEDFMKIRNELVKKDSSLEYDLGMLRKKTIAYHAKKYFKDEKDLNEFVEEAYKFFLEERHKVTFYEKESDIKFSSLARKIFDSELPLDQKMHLRYFVEKIDRICDQAEDIADEVQIYAIKRSV